VPDFQLGQPGRRPKLSETDYEQTRHAIATRLMLQHWPIFGRFGTEKNGGKRRYKRAVAKDSGCDAD
jgi:hypothetical protein